MAPRRGQIEKAFMDPVHGFIIVRHGWLLHLIDTPEFQRLRRIRQLGASFGTYHGAEHSRFGHSLGAFHIMERMLHRLREVNGPFDEETEMTARAAALLHDVGHGPFSHALEYTLTPEVGHEAWTKRILLEDTAIHRVLRGIDASLPERVAAVIEGRSEPRWVSRLVSSQLDVDRMDYLLRDALFTGAEYGRFQLDRVIHTLTLHGDTVAVQRKGLQAIEEYVLARHFMYWRVYLHKTIRGAELLLRAAVLRARRLGAFSPAEAPNLAQYLALDDTDVFVALKTWVHHADATLSDLSRRFLSRDFLKPVFIVPPSTLPPGGEEAARAVVAEAGYDPDSYCLIDTPANVPYDPYVPPADGGDAPGVAGTAGRQPILVINADGEAEEISRLSPLIQSVAGRTVRAVNVYVPAECRERVWDVISSFSA